MSYHHLLIRDLTVSYGRIPAIHHINLDLSGGTRIGLLGPNGAGKTTLIKAIVGMGRFETGYVEVQGQGKARAGQIAYLPQRSSVDWDFPITVRGMAEMGRFANLGMLGSFGPADHDAINQALKVTRLGALADRQISTLSGGQQQRAFLARAYAQQADFYLLDEPFSGLDTNSQADLKEILGCMVAEGKLVLVSHHDLKSVPDLFDQVVLLKGELVAFGPTSRVFTPENIERAYQTALLTKAQP